jgi:hypothetical protein
MTVDVASATVLDLPLAQADPAVYGAISAELIRQEFAALEARVTDLALRHALYSDLAAS